MAQTKSAAYFQKLTMFIEEYVDIPSNWKYKERKCIYRKRN